MQLAELIAALSDPAVYPQPVTTVEVRQTHISVVFLAGQHVYKIKKPVKLGFLDFSTLELRRHFCNEEMRLNARLASEVYLGVVPLVRRGEQLKFGTVDEATNDEPIEWAVWMKRLPAEATLESRLAEGSLTSGQIDELARTVARFHASAQRDERIAGFGKLEVVAANARGNFTQSQAQVGETISRAVFDRLQNCTEKVITELAPLIESRAARGVPCDTHGDLRLDHVYFLDRPDGTQRTLIIDCIEFNEAFRFADPVADMAFLVMDLQAAGHGDLADLFADAYFASSGDDEGRRLLQFYVAYRAAVRGKVEGLKQAEVEVADDDRARARQLARGYWLLALGRLEAPDRRPALVLLSGLPGSGKSTLAAALSEQAGFEWIRSDLVRKELAGEAKSPSSPQAFGTGLYTAEWNQRTYAECMRRAEAILFEGGRVLVDASFREEVQRMAFLAAARRWQVPTVLLECQASPEMIRHRLAGRQHDASDADWTIYQAAAVAWEPASQHTAPFVHTIRTEGTRQQSLQSALKCLRSLGLSS